MIGVLSWMRQIRFGFWSAIAGVIALFGLVVLAIFAWLQRNPDYSCIERLTSLDSTALGIDPGSLGPISGSWSWWPTGVTCIYPSASNGVIAVGPPPGLTVLLVATLVALSLVIALVILGLIARAANHSIPEEIRNAK